MIRQSKWLWLLAAVALPACGSPGQSHQLLHLDGEAPTENDGEVQDRADAARPHDAAPTVGADVGVSPDGNLADGPAGLDLPVDTTSNPVTCGGLGQPCCGGTCNDDGNACNGAEVCLAGTCQHQDPIVCAALDGCHNVGTCQPSTGACTNPPKTGGSCNDGDACTQNDTCQNGTCQGTAMSCGSGLHCSGGSCVCDSTSCKGSKTCVNDACVSCGALNQACCGSSCNTGFSCQGGSCKTTCSSKMGQACDTNTCQPGKYDCSGNCANKAPKNCNDVTKTCDPLNGQCVTCGARYSLCCTAPGVEQCQTGPDDKCLQKSNGQHVCWITAHINQHCGGFPPDNYCKPSSQVQCDTGTDTCVCMFGATCDPWDDMSGQPPQPP
jgi:hypothetical protein